MVGGINHGLDIGLGDESDPFTVGRPRGRAVRAGVGGDLSEVRAFVGVVSRDDPDVRVVVAVGVGRAAVAGEGERLAVRGPDGVAVIEIAGGYLGGLIRSNT